MFIICSSSQLQNFNISCGESSGLNVGLGQTARHRIKSMRVQPYLSAKVSSSKQDVWATLLSCFQRVMVLRLLVTRCHHKDQDTCSRSAPACCDTALPSPHLLSYRPFIVSVQRRLGGVTPSLLCRLCAFLSPVWVSGKGLITIRCRSSLAQKLNFMASVNISGGSGPTPTYHSCRLSHQFAYYPLGKKRSQDIPSSLKSGMST